MKIIESIVVWGLFLGCSVFGHVALKRAAGSSDRFEWGRTLWLWKDPWAMGAGLSWMVSCFLWGLLLTRFGVGEATSQSAVRYVLILAAAAIGLGEPGGNDMQGEITKVPAVGAGGALSELCHELALQGLPAYFR